MNTFLLLIQALMVGAIFVHSACVLSRSNFKGILNPRWLSHVCFIGFSLYAGLNLANKPFVFDVEITFLEAAVLLHLIADYLSFKRRQSACTRTKCLGE